MIRFTFTCGELSLKCGYAQQNHRKVMKAKDGREIPRKFKTKSGRHRQEILAYSAFKEYWKFTEAKLKKTIKKLKE